MTITLDKKMSSEFYDILSAELRCLINEYDPDTVRIPSKKRIANKKILYDITDKWSYTQPHIHNSHFVDLSHIQPCSLTLSTKEATVAKKIIAKALTDLTKFATKNSGALANDITKNKIPTIQQIINML